MKTTIFVRSERCVRTLPAAAYRSEDLFGWEQQHIFGAGWACLGRVDDLLQPGQLRALALLDESG